MLSPLKRITEKASSCIRLMNEKLRVLVVDDSAFVRRRLIRIPGEAPDMEVVGSAGDGLEAVYAVERCRLQISDASRGLSDKVLPLSEIGPMLSRCV